MADFITTPDGRRIPIPSPVQEPIGEGEPIIEDEVGGQESQSAPEHPRSKSDSWKWVGSEREEEDAPDGVSDLFEVNDEDILDDVDSLTDVDMEKDILDAGEDGTLDDLTTVTEEDIMGSKDYGQPVKRHRTAQRPRRVARPYQLPPSGMQGIGY